MAMAMQATKTLIRRIPGLWRAQSLFEAHRNSQNPFLKSSAPGHFYSPIPDLGYIQQHREDLFARDKTSCTGIDLAEDRQIALVRDLAVYAKQMPFPETLQDGARYYFQNPYFGHGSAIILYSLMRHFAPRKIVEVGSGFSSAAMLDVNDRFFDGRIEFTFVEPYPARLRSLLTETDQARHRIHEDIAQHVPASVFTSLQADDFLFIDSSHVAKVGSDVVLLLTEILPTLQPGVIIHIHDIYWPFEYPEDWVLAGRAWNEAYLVKAFLQFNKAFEILLFNSYLAIHQQEVMNESLPGFLPDGGSSLWIRKIA